MMKKLLSLILALTLVITSFAFVGTTVSADTETALFKNLVYGYSATKEGDIKEEVNVNGIDCMHYGRSSSNTAFIQFKIDTALLDAQKYIIAEVPIKFDSTLDRIYIEKGNATERLTLTGIINDGDWNDVKLIWRNVTGEKGYYFINGNYAGEFTVTSGIVTATATNGVPKLIFADIDNPKGTTKEVWIQEDKAKVTQADSLTLLYEADSEYIHELNADTTGDRWYADTVSLENGVYGRAANDTSVYFKRDGNYARIQMYLKPDVSSHISSENDVIVEMSVFLPNDSTRIGLLGDGGTFYNTFESELQYGKWIKAMWVFNFNTQKITLYVDGEKEITKNMSSYISLANYDKSDFRLQFTGDSSEGYINYYKIYEAPTGTVTGIEDKGLTQSSEGYDVSGSTIYTTNTVADLTVADLQKDLNLLEGAVVRAFSDEKCETPIENLTNGCKVAVETESGIIQLFTLKQKELDITDDGIATFNPKEATNGILIVAAYNEDGTLEKIDTLPVSGRGVLTSTVSEAFNYKAFVFNSLADAKPLVEAVSVK